MRYLRAIWLVGTASIIALAFMFHAAIQRQWIRANTLEATSNLRSLSFALHEFETAYGAFPNQRTAEIVPASTDTALSLRTRTSNDFFKQLLVAEICNSESLFYVKIPGARKPDNMFRTDSNALSKGEVGFSYIVGQTSAEHPRRPLVVTPLIPGNNRFDPIPFNGMAIVLCVDGAGTRTGPVFPINKKGEVIDSSGKHILDPANPIWGGEIPVIVWPD